MIDISYSPKLSLRSQCNLVNINRSSYYYKAGNVSEIDLKIMRRIDEIYLNFPFYGSRKITVILSR